MALSRGDHLGPYEILGPVGAGGMGEVYRARDPRLDREVAIKVLPEDVAGDRERLRRFEKEAKAAGALNHPNILAVYDVGAHDGRPFLVAELLQGDTLRERLTQTALSAERAVDYAVQIARGLAAAHDKGIVHRDLKPENLFVTRDGLIKILDFGLAKLRGPQGPREGTGDDDETASRTTDTGAVIGTAGYMSPEQVRGQTVDHRSDIFSFGAVLYEMLSGQRAFRGDSGVEVLSAILTEEPRDIDTAESGLSPQLTRVLKRCLEKKPEDRFQSTRDLTFDLGGVRADAGLDSSSVSPQQPTHSTRLRKATGEAAVLLLGISVGAVSLWMLSRSSAPSRPVIRMEVGVQPAERLSGEHRFQRPHRTDLALSPDGTLLVFGGVRDEKSQLYVRRMDEPTASPIPGTEGGTGPFFSPDGEWLGFWTTHGVQPSPEAFPAGEEGELRKVPMSGGLPVTVCRTPLLFGASWSPDDTIVFARWSGGLWRVPAEGGTPEELTRLGEGEEHHHLPQVLPGGEAVLFTTQKQWQSWADARIVVQVLATGERRVLVEGGADARYVPTGHLVFAREGTLMAAPFDRERLEVTGRAVPVVEGVMQAVNAPSIGTETGAAQFSVSKSGSLVYLEGGIFPSIVSQLVWVDREGAVEPLAVPEQDYWCPRLSPDGRRVVVRIARRNEHRIWVLDISRGTLTPLAEGAWPLWMPDGRNVVFDQGGLVLMAADGSGVSERLTTATPAGPFSWSQGGMPSSCSPDGRELVFVRDNDVWVLPLGEGGGGPRPILQTRFRETHAVLSPDGRWLAYTSNESGRLEVYVQPYPGPGARTQVSVEGGFAPAWRADGRELFFRRFLPSLGRTVMLAAEVTTEPVLAPRKPRELFEGVYATTAETRCYDVTPDGERFLMSKEVERPTPPVTHISVVLNWFEELKRRVPTN